MASPTLSLGSNGEHQNQRQQQLHSKTKVVHENRTTKAPLARTPTSANAAEVDEEADEADSSADEARNEDDSETDVLALSGARAFAGNGEQHLAGLDDGDMFANTTPQKAGVAPASDEDDDYAGVDDVSDDDENEGTKNGIMRAAEMDLINEFERTEQRRDADMMTGDMDAMFLQDDSAVARGLSLSSSASADDVFKFDVNMNDDPFVGLDFGDSLYKEMYNDAERSLGIWRTSPEMRGRQDSEESAGSKKRVRFAEPHETLSRSSSMSSSEDPNDLFPDLFDAQDDPALRQQFGLDFDPDTTFQADFSDTGSCYDFDGEEERMALAIDDLSDSDEDPSDYDDDTEEEGDTTDEDDDDEPLAKVESVQKRTATPKKAGVSTPTPSSRTVVSTPRSMASPATPTPGRGPKMGSFIIDRTRAAMSADAVSKKINVLPPLNPTGKDKAFWERAKNAYTRRNGSPRSSAYFTMRTSATRDLPPRPLTAQSTLGTMFDGNLDILNHDDVPRFHNNAYPESISRAQSSFADSLNDESDEEPSDINMNDFIDLDDDDSDVDELQSASSIMSPQSELCDSFSSLDPQRNDSLLNHLDQQRGLVGAFRHNQTFAKTVSSLASHPATRASASEANALQKGRRAAGNTPMTPARKKRVSQDLSLTGAGIRKSVSSPLASRRPRSRGSSMSGGMNQTLGPSLM